MGALAGMGDNPADRREIQTWKELVSGTSGRWQGSRQGYQRKPVFSVVWGGEGTTNSHTCCRDTLLAPG